VKYIFSPPMDKATDMSGTLKKLLLAGHAGRLAGAQSAGELTELWRQLEIPQDERRRWNLIMDPAQVPVLTIELVSLSSLMRDYSPEERRNLWIRYPLADDTTTRTPEGIPSDTESIRRMLRMKRGWALKGTTPPAPEEHIEHRKLLERALSDASTCCWW